MGPKKAKKSKAELEEERLAREEEERKARAAEEKRLAEEREKQRLEEARIAAEKKIIREQDMTRWREEYEDVLNDLSDRHKLLLIQEKNEQEQLEWLNFKDPKEEIDATVEREMNTFITLMRETPVSDMQDALESIRRIEKLASTVEDVWSNSLANKNYPMQERAFNDLHVLRDMILEKLDVATVPLMRFAEKYLNDRQELNVEEVASQVSIGIWASFNDIRPIRKSVQLERMGVQLDIPKQVLQQHERYVYRVIRMPLVTYNLDFYMHAKGHHVVTLQHNQHHHQNRMNHHHHNNQNLNNVSHMPTSPKALGGGRRRRRSEENNQVPPAAAPAVTAPGAEPVPAPDAPVPPPEGTADASAAAAATAAGEAQSDGTGAPTADVNEEKPKVPALTLEQTAALTGKYIVGDLIYFDILYAPAPPFNLRAKKWLIRDNSQNSTSIRKAAYPSSVASRMFIKVPDYVAMTSDLRVTVWNEEQQDWVEDGITDFQFSEQTRIVQFYTVATGIFALVKKRFSELPLKDWTIAPVLNKPINQFMLYDPVPEKFPLDGAMELGTEAIDSTTAAVEGGDGTNGAQSSDAAAALASVNSEKVNSSAAEGAHGDAMAAEDVHGSDEMKEEGAVVPAMSIVNMAALASALNATESSTSSPTEASTSETHFEKHARLTLHVGQFEVVIDILGSHCMLIKPEEPFCSDIRNKLLSPGVLLMKLQKKGIHLVPTDHDLAFAPGCCCKRRVLEDEVWRHIAQCTSAMEVTSCRKWNTALNDSQIGVLIRECSAFVCPGESYDYECVLLERDEVSASFQDTPELGSAPGPDKGILSALVLGNQYGTKSDFSLQLRPDEKYHIDFSLSLQNRVSPEAFVRMKKTNPQFHKTVYTLMSLIKAYSQT